MNELDQYDYDLPRDLVAQQPLPHRADSRLMLVRKAEQTIEHCHVRDLPGLLREGDCLVLNDTRVIPARIVGRRTQTGGRWEGLFLAAEKNVWKIIAKTRGKIAAGETVTLQDIPGREDLELELIEKLDAGQWLVHAKTSEDTFVVLDRVGRVPLPHYIRGGDMMPTDRERYQTVFARHAGSVAAPTAGLHLTVDLLEKLGRCGIETAYVTLHVGLDTFRPITAESLAEHAMHQEWASIDEAAVSKIQGVKAGGGRIVAVGTTTVRVLESAARDGDLAAWNGSTDLFIRPPYDFRVVDGLMTNFHLPRTTLLVLAYTFGGPLLVQRAYQEAIEQKYRFYSYGDAMLII